MTDIGIGALGYVGYAKEVTEGLALAPTMYLPVMSFNFPENNDYLTPLDVRGNRDISVAMQAPFNVSGTMDLNLPVNDIGYLLKSAFAATVSTSAYSGGGYTHVMTPAGVTDTFTFEESHQAVLIRRYSGVRVNTLSVKSTFGEIVTASFGLEGTTRSKFTGTAAVPAYASTSTTPLHFIGSYVKIGGVDSVLVKDLTFGVNNNISRIGVLMASRAYRRMAFGPRNVTLSMSMDFYDGTEYDRVVNDTEFAVSLVFEGPIGIGSAGASKTYLQIDLPRVKYSTMGSPLNAGDVLSQDFECTVLKPNSASAIFTATLANTTVSLA
jgi:hypothetical protein